MAQPGQGPSLQQLYEAAQNPWLNDTQRAIIGAEIERQQQVADPLRQLQLEKMRRDIAAPQKNWQKLDDNTLFEPSTGEIKQVGGGDNTGAFRFGGNSVEAQALNGLIDSGALMPEQAQQLAAGKTVTNPADGSIMFMTPQGIFGQPAQDGPPQPIGPTQGGSQLFAPNALGGDAPAAPATQSGQRDGMIRLTDAKPEKPTLDERNAMTFADRLKEASAIVDQVEGVGKSTWAQSITDNDYIPDVLENMMVGEDFQKFAQARRNFINAVLRGESGAVISASEFADANKQYFPMPGDTKEVLEQKRRNRQTVLDGMVRAGGKTYPGNAGNDYKSRYGLE